MSLELRVVSGFVVMVVLFVVITWQGQNPRRYIGSVDLPGKMNTSTASMVVGFVGLVSFFLIIATVCIRFVLRLF
jgi:hypothetical protein